MPPFLHPRIGHYLDSSVNLTWRIKGSSRGAIRNRGSDLDGTYIEQVPLHSRDFASEDGKSMI